MSANEPAPKSPTVSLDEAATLLRAAARKRRPWKLTSVLLAALFFGIPLALLVWWLRSTSALPPLAVIAFDEITSPGKPAVVRVQVAPIGESDGRPNLSRLELFLVDPVPAGPDSRKSIKVTADEHGAATSAWSPAAADSLVEVEVRYLDARARARIFPLPPSAKILLVEVEALIEAGEGFWQREDLIGLPALNEAREALRRAAEREMYVVYLATGPSRALDYQRIRDYWIERRVSDPVESSLPAGPVLGRPNYGPDMNAQTALQEIAAHLKQLFREPVLAVTRSTDTATTLREAGVTTLRISQDGASWDDVKQRIR
jgi:hypothetical protein